MLLDVDYFKNYNDYNGHPEGDRCLQLIAEVLSSNIRRSGEIVSRYGGEEFAAILPACTGSEALARAERLLQSIWDMAVPHARSLVADRVTVSIGICTYHSTANKTIAPEKLIKMADQMLYQAKREGRNRFILTELTDD